MKKIMVPTDLSESAVPAIELALTLAEPETADLELLYVIDTHGIRIDPLPSHFELDSEEWRVEMAHQYREALRRLDRTPRRDIPVHCATASGNPREVIVRQAREKLVDLIVMNTHGSGHLKNMLGGVAHRVAQSAPCNVVTVRTGQPVALTARHDLEDAEVESALPPNLRLKHILVAVDFAAGSIPALVEGSRLASIFDADITILHINEASYPALQLLNNGYLDGLRQRLTLNSSHRLAEFLEQHAAQLDYGLLHAPRLNGAGEPAAEIEKAALEMDVDLVIIGQPAHRGIREMLMANVAEEVMRFAPCPVMTVPAPQHIRENIGVPVIPYRHVPSAHASPPAM